MSDQKVHYVPQQCVYEATLQCNLNCRHCGSSAGKARGDELTTQEASDMFKELAALGCRRITIAGGEPTLRPDWLDLIGHAAEAGLRVGMLTNALRFDRPAAVAAKENGLHSVGFSLDGMGPVHDRTRGRIGHFNQIMSAMDVATDAGIPFAAVTCIHTENIQSLEEMQELLSQKGAYAWQVQIGADMGNLHQNPDLLLKPDALPVLEERLARLIRRSNMPIYVADSIGYYGPHEKTLRKSVGGKPFGGCGAGIRNLGIESNGNIKGCLSIMAGYNAKGKDFVEGNLRDRSLTDIWNDDNAFAYNRRWSIDDLEGFCHQCKHVFTCRGGCKGKRVASGGGTANPFCVTQVLGDQRPPKRANMAAAIALAAAMGNSAVGCSVPLYGIPPGDYSEDTDTDTNTDTDTGTGTDTDTGTGTDTDTDTGTDTDTDTESPDGGVMDGGPDVDLYGIPDTDS